MVVARERRRWQPWGGGKGALVALLVIALIVIAVVALFVWVLDDDEAAFRGVTVAEIYADPLPYYNEDDITVSGEVNRVLSPFAYTIGGEEFGDIELLVVGPPPAAVAEGRPDDELLLRGDIVQVVGELQPFTVSEVEAMVNGDLPDERLAEFEEQPALVALGTVLTPRTAVLRGEPASVEEILEDPQDWFDETVTVTGEVVQALGPNLFVFAGEDGNQVLVVDATEGVAGAAAVAADIVQVSGPVIPFDMGIIETRTQIDLDDAAVANVPTGTPTILAWAIQIV